MPLVQPHAGSAHNTFQNQGCFAFVTGLPHKAFLQIIAIIQLELIDLAGNQFLCLRGFFGSITVEVCQTTLDNGAGDCLAAAATHRLSLTINFYPVVGAGRDRQTTVETFLPGTRISQLRNSFTNVVTIRGREITDSGVYS